MKAPVTDEQIAAALAKHANNRMAAIKEVHIGWPRLDAYCQRNGIPYAGQAQARHVSRSREAEVVAALRKHRGDRRKAALEVGVHVSTAREYAKRHGIPALKWRKANHPCELIRWDSNNVLRLLGIYMRVPKPSNNEIAAEMNTKPPAVQTALSRHGLVRSRADGFTSRNERRVRGCLICVRPFLSTDSGHRQCAKCWERACTDDEAV